MYGLRDEAKKRGYSVDWDAATGNVKIGSQSYTPQMLQGLGGTNDGGSWKMSQQAINAMLGNAQPSYSQGAQPYSHNAPVQYQPYEYKQFDQPAPDYNSLFQHSLQQYMKEQPRLAERAVDAVDTQTAARGMYRSGVRDSLATQATTELESALRQLAQQQAQGLYGQELGKYATQLSNFNQQQQLAAQQHNQGQQFANENYWQTQNQQLRQQEFANQLAQQQWAQNMADRELEQQLRIAQMNNAARYSGAGTPTVPEPAKPDPELYQEVTALLAELDDYTNPAKRNAIIDTEIQNYRREAEWGLITPDDAQRVIAALEGKRLAPRATYTPTQKLDPYDYGYGID